MEYKDYPIKYIELLDKCLTWIKESSKTNSNEIYTVRKDEIEKPYWLPLIRHFEKDGYVFIEKHEKECGGFNERVYPSIYGLAFMESGGFANRCKNERKKAKDEAVQNFPKKYWYILAAITYFIGVFTPILTEKLKSEYLPQAKKQSIKATSNRIDTVSFSR
jgi:hypothetical protein